MSTQRQYRRIGVWTVALGLAGAAALATGCGASPASPTQIASTSLVVASEQTSASAASKTESFSVYVDALTAGENNVWLDTGFTLKDGVPVTVTATGVAGLCPGIECQTGPGGSGTGPGGALWCADGGLLAGGTIPCSALVARVGSGGTPFLVGSGPITVSGAGSLQFAYNDAVGGFFNNVGGFTATVSYSCQPGNGNGDKNHYHCGPPGRQ